MLSTSASFGCTIGKATAATIRTASAIWRRSASGMRAKGRRRIETAAVVVPFMWRALLRLAGRDAPEQSRRLEHQHEDQDREDDHVGPGRGDELSAHRLDQAYQHAAHHGARHVADATQHG